MSLRRIVPLVPALDIEESAAFYTAELGFQNLFQLGEPATYVGVRRDGVEFHLYKTDNRVLTDMAVIRLETEEIEVDYEAYRSKAYLHRNGKLELKSSGFREFSLVDPSGVLVTFFQK